MYQNLVLLHYTYNNDTIIVYKRNEIMSTQIVNISLPKQLLVQVDDAAKAEFASRSDYIRQALVSKLRADKAQADDWNLLEALSDEITQNARAQTIGTDDDFVRIVKEVRSENLTSRK